MCVLSLLVATTTAAHPSPLPPLLTSSPEVYMLVVDGTKPKCQRWTNDTSTHRLVRVDGKERAAFTYRPQGKGLLLENFELDTGYGASTTTCTSLASSQQLSSDTLAIGFGDEAPTSQWFATRASCEAAIAHHGRVGTDLPCDLHDLDTTTDAEKTANLTRFVRILKRGGVMYTEDDDRCEPVRFYARRTSDRPGTLEGGFKYHVAASHSTDSYGFVYEPDGDYLESHGPTMTLLGPGFESDDHTMSGGMGCMDILPVQYIHGGVIVAADLYFTARQCKRAIADESARERAREAWIPSPDDETPAAMTAAPLAGGC